MSQQGNNSLQHICQIVGLLSSYLVGVRQLDSNSHVDMLSIHLVLD